MTFSPPKVPDFPDNFAAVVKTLAPYHKAQRPLDFFFELYVCHVLEALPQQSLSALDEFSQRFPAFFAHHGGDWKQFVVKECKLSDTFDVAVWDLWIINSQKAKADGWDCRPWYFAQLFHQQFVAEGSQVDVWNGDALQVAKDRISAYKMQMPSTSPAAGTKDAKGACKPWWKFR